ncbi:NWD1 protein, partial [Polypterus senegalus]
MIDCLVLLHRTFKYCGECSILYHLFLVFLQMELEALRSIYEGDDCFKELSAVSFQYRSQDLAVYLKRGSHVSFQDAPHSVQWSVSSLIPESQQEEEQEHDKTDLLLISRFEMTGGVQEADHNSSSVESYTAVKGPDDTGKLKKSESADRYTIPERTAIMQNVYPNLLMHCKQQGYDIRLVDLRWGLQDGVCDDNTTAQLHLDIMRECQETGEVLFFLFTGQKHDARSVPTCISHTDFDAIVSVIESKKLEAMKMRKHQVKDNEMEDLKSQAEASFNSMESLSKSSNDADQTEGSFALSSESRVDPLPTINGEAEKNTDKGSKSKKEYEKELNLLCMWYKLDENYIPASYCLQPVSSFYKDYNSKDSTRRQQAKHKWLSTSEKLYNILHQYAPAALGEKAADCLLRTVMEAECDQAQQVSIPTEACCYLFKRVITDIKFNLDNEKASDYIDTNRRLPEINQEMHSAHQRFLDSIYSKLHRTNIYEYSVGWGHNGIDPQLNRSHFYYIERISNDFQKIVLNRLKRATQVMPLRAQPAWSRKDVFRNQIKDEIYEHVHHCQALNVNILVRFIGVTGESRNVRLLLQSMCFQLSEMYQIKVAFSEKLTVQSNIISIPPLNPAEVEKILTCWLERDHRRLQSAQWKLIREACMTCPIPLYLQCAYMECKQWPSFVSPTEIYLPTDLSKLYTSIISRLEKQHGAQFVKKVLSLISISKNGITLEELIDLLSVDQKIMSEVEQFHQLPAPKFPFVLWAKFQKDLGKILVEQKTDATYVYNWANVSFKQACEERYLKTKDAQIVLHTQIAEYFLEKRKPAVIGNTNLYSLQPLAWIQKTETEKNYFFNMRKLCGLSYHLIKSNQITTLVTECLFNYEFLLHKIWGVSVAHVEEDLKSAMSPEREIIDLNVLSETLQLSKKVLLQDPCQLASQLLGRLYQIISADRPVAPGHTDKITAVAAAKKDLIIVTASRDRTLKLWDLSSGKSIKTLHGVGRDISSIALCMDNTLVALTEGHSLQIWEVSSGRMVYCENDSLDIPVITCTMDGQILVAFYDGSHFAKVFDLAVSCRPVHQVDITPEDSPIHKDHSILVSQNSVKDFVLFAYRSGKEAMVLSAKKGDIITKLTAHEPVASIKGVDMTRDYFLLICRYPYMRLHEIIHIEIFSTASFEYLRSVKGCCNDPFSLLSVNRVGSHVITFCSSPDTNTSEVITWNLETEDHKHIVKTSCVVTGGTCFDLRYCLAACENENSLRIWNLASKINDQSLTYNVHNSKKHDGTEEIISMVNYPRYVVCKSLTPGTVRVWNIVKTKYKGNAVRVERGLYESTDIVLVRDMKLYILTDRGMAAFTETPRPIFQTMLVYDLLKKKYVKKKTGLYIIPCQKHEYRILPGDLLLGLAENRDHLVIWNLETGFIKSRIRPDYKDHLLLPHGLNASLGPKNTHYKELISKFARMKQGRYHMTPWERRNETKTAKTRRAERELQDEMEQVQQIDREKHNPIEQFLISGDEQVIVCSYYAHHLNVFDLVSESHCHVLEDQTSMLFLHNAALTHSGSHLAISNYNDLDKTSYVTLWDLKTGKVRKRLKNEPNVCCMAVTDDAHRIVFGVMEVNKLKVWDPFKKQHKTIPGYENLRLGVKSQLHLTDEGAKVILLAGDVSLWDLNGGFLISVFTPDSKIQCLSLTCDRKTMLIGMSDKSALISLKLMSKEIMKTSTSGLDLFGEQPSSSE